jgi:hypothetical protein
MMPERGVHERPALDVESAVADFTNGGARVYVLPHGIRDQRGFFEAVKAVLPLDPPVMGNTKWDALSDSLWSGLDGLDAQRIAIIWPGATEMASASPEDFEAAKEVLTDVTELLADHEATVGNVKQVVVVLA